MNRRIGPLRLWHLGAIAILIVVVLIGVNAIAPDPGPPAASAPTCRVSDGTTTYQLDLEQAAHATTIAAVGKRLGLPDHAVSVALAAALQESKLHNLTYGDRDSVGLFQQRPSQGWGPASQLVIPTYAATAFYRRLAIVDGWETLSVTDAAQHVQRSAAPNAYARWEAQARAIAQALTGQVPAGFTCQLQVPQAAKPTEQLAQRLSQELGLTTLATSLPTARGWAVASWMIGHAEQLRITSVAFSGQTWTPESGKWAPSTPMESRVRIVRTPVAASVP
ncbi:MAG: hypothetical protein M3159_08395 [Actinomycetota bacterium]|nr:hypothetical protein [Actinomycetota bacterium]